MHARKRAASRLRAIRRVIDVKHITVILKASATFEEKQLTTFVLILQVHVIEFRVEDAQFGTA